MYINAAACQCFFYRPFWLLNLSQASFNVLKTALDIIRCSVVALVGI